MNILNRLIEYYNKSRRTKTINLLKKINTDKLIEFSKKEVLSAFKRTVKYVPGYNKLLQDCSVNPDEIRDINTFINKVPVIDKKSVFENNKVEDFAIGGNLNDIKTVLTSSGYSGIFSFGANTQKNLTDSTKSIDLGLDYSFDISTKKSFLINCLPMGVKVNTSLPIAETSVREDMVCGIIKQLSSKYDQTILVGEGSFLKKVIEDGQEQGIDWKSQIFHLVTGEEGIAENYRSYIADILDIDFNDPSKGMIGSSMGIAELDLNIFHETNDTIFIRRLAHNNPEIRKALFGENVKVCPMLFVFYPHRTFVEEQPSEFAHNHIIISMLSSRLKIPLIRYNTQDLGRILYPETVKNILKQFNHSDFDFDLKLPLIAIYGRGGAIEYNNNLIYPEEIKEALYADFEIASLITGAFKLSKEASKVKLEIQLKNNKILSEDLKDKLITLISNYSSVPVNLTTYSYNNFPYFMKLNYEIKFRYL